MKCPKCQYVSHDYLEVCRKCGVDLAAFKRDMGLSVLQPGVLDLSLVLMEAGADDLFESVEMAESLEAGPAEGIDDVASVAAAPGAMTSGQWQELVLAEDTPVVPAEPDLEIIDPMRGEATLADAFTSSDIFTLEDLDESLLPGHLALEPSAPELPTDLTPIPVEEAERMPPRGETETTGAPSSTSSEQDLTTSDAVGLGDISETTLPGHLTLELDVPEIMPQWSSLTLDDLQLDDPPGDIRSNMSPPQNQAGDEETLLLDLDDLETDDGAQA